MERNKLIDLNIERLCDALDIEYQIGFVKEYEKIGDSKLYGGKHCGSDAEQKGAEYIAEILKEIGVESVELVPCNTARYQFNDASIKMEGEDRVIKPYGYVSPGTDESGVCSCIVDAVKARKEDLSHIDIEGKIILIDAMGTLEGANLSGQIEMAMKHGAAGIVICAVDDVLNDETIRVQPPNVICTVPVVGICKKDAAWLREKMAEGVCNIELIVDAEFDPYGGTTYNVVGEIPGAVSEEKIIYTAHLDHYFRCLQDNMSTCSTLLGIAKAIIDSGYKPNRSIVFAFHGSHETGGIDTRYPYIYGSYKLTHESKPEWTGKAIANINFEYTALRMKKLQAVAYVGVNNLPISYYPYSPDLIGEGFNEKIQYSPQTEYYMLSWSDCISYHTAGIPTICNDPISEQYYEGTGPYVGRDHSNFDNWDVFDRKILEDVGRYYGGLGIYLDNMPYLMLDYTEYVNRIKNELDTEMLSTLGISHDSYSHSVEALEKAAEAANKIIAAENEAYIKDVSYGLSAEEQKRWFEKAHKFNEKMLSAYKLIADELDRINAYDFIGLESVTYIQNVKMLLDAKNSLMEGSVEKALETIMPVDLAASSYYFDEEVVEHMRKQICDPEFIDRRTWAAGRELKILSLYRLVNVLTEEIAKGQTFDETIKELDAVIQMECSLIPKALAREAKCIKMITEIITN